MISVVMVVISVESVEILVESVVISVFAGHLDKKMTAATAHARATNVHFLRRSFEEWRVYTRFVTQNDIDALKVCVIESTIFRKCVIEGI